MAFIREYSMQGDPFSLRRPKWLRTLKVGRALGKIGRGVLRVAGPVASFVPGVGSLVGRLASIASKYGLPAEVATEFARSYGLDMGDAEDFETDESGMGMSGYMNDPGDALDYLGDPAPRPARKRKTAAGGPRLKAEKKRAKRAERHRRRGGPSVGAKIGRSLGAGARAVGGAIPGLIAAFKAGGPMAAQAYMATSGAGGSAEESALAEMTALMAGAGGKGHKGAGFFRQGAKRRAMNPVNVKALRRSIRRLEGFQNVVKRVTKQFPQLRGASTTRSGPRRSKGHRSGCGCVVCKRSA